MRRINWMTIGFVLLMGTAALAEDVNPVFAENAFVIPTRPNFYLAIIVGVILAVSFELILTHLSVAAGISSVGPFDKWGRYGKREAEPAKPGDGEGAIMRTVRKTSSMFGIWALITA